MQYQYYKMTPNLNLKSEHVATKEAFLGFNLAMLTKGEFEILNQILTQNSKVPSCLVALYHLFADKKINGVVYEMLTKAVIDRNFCVAVEEE